MIKIYKRNIRYYENKINSLKFNYYSFGAGISIILFSPLYVISVLKQLSVIAHKDIYKDPNIKSFPQLEKKSKLNSIINSTIESIPFFSSKKSQGKEILNVKKNLTEKNDGKEIILKKEKINRYDNPITIRDKINKNLIDKRERLAEIEKLIYGQGLTYHLSLLTIPKCKVNFLKKKVIKEIEIKNKLARKNLLKIDGYINPYG